MALVLLLAGALGAWLIGRGTVPPALEVDGPRTGAVPEPEQPAQPEPVEAASQPVAEPQRPAPAAQPRTEVLPETRQVIPGREANVPRPGDEVVRLPAPPVPVQPPRPVNLGIVVVESANRLETRRGAVTLAGTRAVDADQTCRLADGRAPLCAVLARTAVRRFVGRKRVDCVLAPRQDAGEAHVAPCTAGGEDMALWVVGQGWAYAAEGAPDALREAERAAREAGLGLWAILPAASP